MNENNENQNNLSEEDYLKRHIENIESNKSSQNLKQNTVIVNSTTSDLEYFSFDASALPCGVFYPAGTTIQVRPAQVKEIQAYSMVDDNNFHDIVEKMNDMLSSCIRVKYANGEIDSYLAVKDPDRFFLVFMIRELTFQKGTVLTTNVDCTCGEKVSIELIRENFRFYDIDSKISKYYDSANRCFRFKTKNGDIFNLAPPTIGIQKSFTEWIIKENSEKRKLNMSLLKIVPFLLIGKTSISLENIKSEQEKYEKLDNMSFQFLNDVVGKLTFGIEKLVKKCSKCGQEVRTEMTFPGGASGIFVIPGSFDQFIQE